MSTTLTIRTDEALREELGRRAEALGVGVSELVRNLLHEALASRPLDERAGALKGRLKLLRRSSDPLRARIRRRNWRR